MSNLLKKSAVISKSERVIDYNEIIRAKLRTLSSQNQADPDGFVTGLTADVVEELISDEAGMESAASGEMAAEDYEQLKQEAAELLEDANVQAQQIIDEAQSEAQGIMEQAQQQGYNDGLSQAGSELERKKQELELEYSQRMGELEDDYAERRKQLEPQLVEVITDIFEAVTHTVAEDNKEIILHLINGVLKNSEKSREFVIKASPDDYRFLINNQGKLYCAMTREVTVDITEDVTLQKNQCIIETDGGVFNCSLDIELNNLIKKIKLLSCV